MVSNILFKASLFIKKNIIQTGFIFTIICLLFPVLLFPQLTKFVPPKPAYAKLYNDENAFAYYHAEWRKLEDKLINHRRKTGNELVIILIPSTGGYPIEELANTTFRQWGIGDNESNNGLLLLIARKEKQIKIENGYGVEGQVTDLASGTIIKEILDPVFSKFDYLLPPARDDKGYLPALEKAIDSLIYLTKEINTIAVKNLSSKTGKQITKKRSYIFLYIVCILGFFFILKAGWRWLNSKLSEGELKQRKKSESNFIKTYLTPALILIISISLILFFKMNWWWLGAAFVFLFLRWIYYLPSPERKKKDIEWEQQYLQQKRKHEEEYEVKKKQLGNVNDYSSMEEYLVKYKKLGMAQLEKALMIGYYAPKTKKRKSSVGSLLYDYFLGNNSIEDKKNTSSTQSKGYSGESTGGQSAGDYGGGSSGGGGAAN